MWKHELQTYVTGHLWTENAPATFLKQDLTIWFKIRDAKWHCVSDQMIPFKMIMVPWNTYVM